MLYLRDMEKRLQRLEEQLIGDPVIILVGDSKGNNFEMTVPEYIKRWKKEGLGFIRILRGYDPTFRDIDAILSVFFELAEMDRGLDDGKDM